MCRVYSGSSASSCPGFLISLRAFQVDVIRNPDLKLVDRPVTAHVLHGAKLAERHRVDRSAVMPQLPRAQGEGLDRALVGAALDVFADPERVGEQVEIPLITSFTSVWAPNPPHRIPGRLRSAGRFTPRPGAAVPH